MPRGSKSSDWTPERKAKLSAAIKARYADPDERERIANLVRETRAWERANGIKRPQNVADSERKRQRCVEWNKDPERRAKHSARMKELWATKHYREKTTRSLRISQAFSPKGNRGIEALKALHRENMKDPAKRAEAAARLAATRNTDTYRANHKKAMADPAFRAKLKCPRPRCGVKIPKSKWTDYFTYMKKGFTSVEAVERMGLR